MKFRFKILIFLFVFVIGNPYIVNAKFGSNKKPEVKKDAAMITTRGAIFLNKKIGTKYLKDYNYVDITYSFANSILTIKPVKVIRKNSIGIHRTRKGKVIIIIKKNFLKNIGAGMLTKAYFNGVWNSNVKAIEVDYTKPVTRDNLE
jgi:hypothetical protein